MTVLSFTTGVREGDARAAGKLHRLLKSKRLSPFAARAEQVHGSLVQIVGKLRQEKTFAGADGLLTDASDQPLAIFTADCVPIFLQAESSGIIGVLHAGWRGVRTRILSKAVKLMRHRWHIPAVKILAWVGPSIGPCCFEVQWDVAKHFPLTRRRRRDRWMVDLAGELRDQAKRLGIRWVSQKASNDCTMHYERHFSYRRDKTEKRQASVIMRRGNE